MAPPEGPSPSASQRIEDRARELGFDAVGFAQADAPLSDDHARYEAFLDAGMHGEMAYLAENRDARLRADGPAILEGARTVICVAARYGRVDDAAEAPAGSIAPLIARYARGQDYHNRLRKRLRQLAAFVRTLGDDVEARPMIDTAPVLERAWAVRAGLGFIGKNGLLIVPGQGSLLLVGEVVTTLALPPGTPMAERCGSCTRCLDACPTGAFPRPFVLDARRCVSYLTIEQRGPMAAELREGVGAHLFGCDDCQDACPFNRTRPPPPEHTARWAPHPRWRELSLEALLEVDEERWLALREGTPLRRATLAGLVRNAVTALANQGATEALPAIERLAREHEDPAVREHAAWAAARLRARASSS